MIRRTLVILTAAALGGVAGHELQGGAEPHSCNAPCDVVLPAGTHEDEFGLNFWVMHEDGRPRVLIWKEATR